MAVNFGPGLHAAAGHRPAYDRYLRRWSRLFVPATLAAAEVGPSHALSTSRPDRVWCVDGPGPGRALGAGGGRRCLTRMGRPCLSPVAPSTRWYVSSA